MRIATERPNEIHYMNISNFFSIHNVSWEGEMGCKNRNTTEKNKENRARKVK